MGFVFNGGTGIVLEVIIKDQVVTSPPQGKNKVTNLFVDPETGKLEVEYDDAPIE